MMARRGHGAYHLQRCLTLTCDDARFGHDLRHYEHMVVFLANHVQSCNIPPHQHDDLNLIKYAQMHILTDRAILTIKNR